MWGRITRWWSRLLRKPVGYNIRFSPEEAELVEFWVEKKGTSIQDFLKESVIQAIPPQERNKFAGRHALGSVIDASWALFDGETLALPPKEEAKPAQTPRNHPCGFLSDTFSPPYDANTSQGTCTHPVKKTLPCFWPAATARNCEYFRTARVKKK